MKKIGRVHWVLHHLPFDFKNAYNLQYDYALHRYCFYRNFRYNLLDCFIVVRTSKKCFRAMYYNYKYKYITYFSEKSSILLVKKMYKIFKTFEFS